jgi:flagellar protein FlaJ
MVGHGGGSSNKGRRRNDGGDNDGDGGDDNREPKLTDGTLVYFVLLLFGVATGQVQPVELVRAAGNARHYGFFASVMGQIYSVGVEWKYGLATAAEMASVTGGKRRGGGGSGDGGPVTRLSSTIAAVLARKNATTTTTTSAADHKGGGDAGEFSFMLARMAQVMRLGDDLAGFFRQELDTVIDAYRSAYERAMKSMELVLEMYSTMMSTASFMIAAMVIMSMIYGGGDSNGDSGSGIGGSTAQVLAVVVAINSALAAFVFMAYMIFPRDRLTVKAPGWLRRQAVMMSAVSVAILVALLVIVAAGGTVAPLAPLASTIPATLAVSAAGVPLLIPGIRARRIEGRIRSLDDSYASFARHFCDIYSTVGSVGGALRSVLRSDFGQLTPHIRDMYTRVINRVSARQALELMSSDVNSASVSAGNAVLASCIEKGADMREVGGRLSDVALMFAAVKKKRQQSAKAFESTVLIMHVLTLTVFALMNRLIGFFQFFFTAQQHILASGGAAAGAGGSGAARSIIAVSSIDPSVMALILPAEAAALAVMNSLALKVYQGGLYYTALFNIGLFMAVGGVILYGADMMLGNMLDSIIDLKGLEDMTATATTTTATATTTATTPATTAGDSSSDSSGSGVSG